MMTIFMSFSIRGAQCAALFIHSQWFVADEAGPVEAVGLIDRIGGRPKAARPALSSAAMLSVVPEDRHPTKMVAIDRHMADGWERHVGGHQKFAGLR
ncbi:hypothetical protein GCM10010520_59940 [Rhizobium viscosum]